MLKTVITPSESTFPLSIPPYYIGKKVEVLLYSRDELFDSTTPKSKKPSDFFGTLSVAEGEKFQEYVNNSRKCSTLFFY